MEKITLFYDTPNEIVAPIYGKGEGKYDFDANKVTKVFSTLFEE